MPIAESDQIVNFGDCCEDDGCKNNLVTRTYAVFGYTLKMIPMLEV